MENITLLLKAKMGTIVAITANEEQKSWFFDDDLEFLDKDAANQLNGPLINLTGKSKIEFNLFPPVIAQTNSLLLHSYLFDFFPDKKFVMVKRWKRLEYRDPSVWEEYLEVMCELIEDDATLEGEVLIYHDQITITDENGDDEHNPRSRRIMEYPGCLTADHLNYYYHAFDYDDLYLFEEEVFNNLKVDTPPGVVNVNGKNYPYAPHLVLDTEKYNNSLIFV